MNYITMLSALFRIQNTASLFEEQHATWQREIPRNKYLPVSDRFLFLTWVITST